MSEKIHKRGRPSKSHQYAIKKELKEYYENDASTVLTKERTGRDIKTVRKYYDLFDKEIIDTVDPDFVKETHRVRRQGAYAIENIILNLKKKYDDTDKRISNQNQTIKNSEFVSLIKEYRNYSNDILSAIKERTTLLMSPPADVVLEKRLEELVKKILRR
ncbi:MAG: hypothetical protein ACRD92_02735 [Nitrosopumilaceae archaeon]